MSDQKERSVGSKILRDRALEVLRSTRAKMDPTFLERMKAHLAPFAHNFSAPTSTAPVANTEKETVAGNTVESRAQSFAALLKGMNVTQPSPEPVAVEPASKRMDTTEEPVDKQKIALIVMNYMKNRPKH